MSRNFKKKSKISRGTEEKKWREAIQGKTEGKKKRNLAELEKLSHEPSIFMGWNLKKDLSSNIQ